MTIYCAPAREALATVIHAKMKLPKFTAFTAKRNNSGPSGKLDEGLSRPVRRRLPGRGILRLAWNRG